jgi:uncharacterized protein (TIGR04141 family)
VKLTLYMFNENVQSLDECLLSAEIRKEKGISLIEIGNGQKLDDVEEYRIYWVKSGTKKPSWLAFVKSHVKPEVEKQLKNRTESLLVLLKVKVSKDKYRIFATSGGYGYHLLEDYRLEPNFGLKTALKSLTPDKIRQLDSIQPGTQTRQKREVTNISGRISEFDFECDSEILRTIAGDCDGNPLADKISGSDNLKLTGDGDFGDIGRKCKMAFETYTKKKLPEAFEFIDYIQHVKQQDLIQALDQQLAQALFGSDHHDRLALAHPDMLDMDAYEKFEIFGQGHKEEVEDISMESVRTYLANSKKLKEADDETKIHVIREGIRITCYDALIGQHKSTKPIYSYLSFETDFDGSTYVFNNRKWYKVDKNYFETVERFIQDQVKACPCNDLTPWYLQPKDGKLVHHETLYNSSYENADGFLVLDRQFFRNKKILGKIQIEIADLYHRDSKRLYCIKKYRDLGDFSHLLAQGSISAELFRKEASYRETFINKLASKWTHVTFEEAICNDSIFVYALGAPGDAFDIKANLTFFAKLNLKKHIQSINAHGFPVEMAHIQMVHAEAEPTQNGHSNGKRAKKAVQLSGDRKG